MKILIGEISSFKAINCASYIKVNYRENIEIITFDFRKHTRVFRTKYSDKHYIVSYPKGEYIQYLKDISDIIKKENIDFFFPVSSKYIRSIIENRNLFGNSLNYIGTYEAYKILNNKNLLIEYLSNNNLVKIPKRFNSLSEAEIPFVCKPEESSASRGVKYIKNQNDLKKIKTYNQENTIIQEYIEGTGVGLGCFAKNGEIIAFYTHKRLAEYPITGGTSVYRDYYENSELLNTCNNIIKPLKWSGFIMFEFKLAGNNELYLIEINPRIWGSINQGLQNGVNYFAPLLGISPEKGFKKNKIIKTYLSPFIYLVLLQYVLKGNFKPLFLFLKNINSNKSDLSFIKDIFAYISVILRKLL
ncbi:MAG: ATP-grasp domain-containing protein [Bacteroidales bacterium]|nr:ATP-grasp domain-containing protein [Bacteroidales bacterium]